MNFTNVVSMVVVVITTGVFTFALWLAPAQGIGYQHVIYIGFFPLLFLVAYFVFIYGNYRFSHQSTLVTLPPLTKKLRLGTKQVWIKFIVVGVALVFLALCLNWAVNSAEKIYKLTPVSSGGLILAVFNGLPEIVVVFQFVKRNYLQAGVGSIIGSQIFNIAQIFFGDLSYQKGTIISGQNGSHLWLLGLTTTIMLLALAFFLFSPRRKKNTSLLSSCYLLV